PPMNRARVATAALATAITALAVGAPLAAASYGRGLYGSTSDKAVTYTGFALIAFFPLFAFTMSRIQGYLEHRKEARKALAHPGLSDGPWRGGW
ncbi:MAG: hypothetical protein KGJ43_06355, partial [Acidobacteriota bacterium]|nr:hypothetical protein [Acidobacteriota bacterium]